MVIAASRTLRAGVDGCVGKDEDFTFEDGVVAIFVGRGRVVTIPFDLLRYIERTRLPQATKFLAIAATALQPRLTIRVEAPPCVDVILRRRRSMTHVHLVNRLNGLPGRPADTSVDAIPFVGPIYINLRGSVNPTGIRRVFEPGGFKIVKETASAPARMRIRIDRFRLHTALVVR